MKSFIGRTDAEAEAPILWPHDAKNWLIGKDPDAGKDWKQEEKGMTEDEMVGWHHQHNGHEFEQALRVGDGQGSLVCFSPWGCKESDMTERLNWLILIIWKIDYNLDEFYYIAIKLLLYKGSQVSDKLKPVDLGNNEWPRKLGFPLITDVKPDGIRPDSLLD